jgi:hypothetical protein
VCSKRWACLQLGGLIHRKKQAEDPTAISMKGVVVASPKKSNIRVNEESLEVQSLKTMVLPERYDDLGMLRARIDRVQGLLGTHLNDSEEDLLFEEVRGSQTKVGINT